MHERNVSANLGSPRSLHFLSVGRLPVVVIRSPDSRWSSVLVLEPSAFHTEDVMPLREPTGSMDFYL